MPPSLASCPRYGTYAAADRCDTSSSSSCLLLFPPILSCFPFSSSPGFLFHDLVYPFYIPAYMHIHMFMQKQSCITNVVEGSTGARRAGFRQRTKASTGGAGEEVFQELQRLNSGDIVKLKGNTYGAKGSTRSGSKETSRPDGIKTSQLPSLNRKLKIDFGGL